MNSIYNPLKLSVYRHLFRDKKVLIIGGGAVGSYVGENVTKMGSSVSLADFDTFTLENAAKHSGIVRTPEDAGKNKAVCVAERVRPLLEEGCISHGVDTDLCMLGPEVIAAYDVVILCVDNFAAKALFNELYMAIPAERRPIVIMDGTHDEMAQSVILDGKDFCVRCLLDEKWLKDGAVRTSCSGPQIREIDGEPEIVRTSGLASSIAASLSAEQYRAAVIGAEGVMNSRITYTAYPHLELSVSHPMRKRDCPGCQIKPPDMIYPLSGSVLNLTLDGALKQIQEILGTEEFEVAVHALYYKNIVYSGFIVTDVCHACGRPISVMKHEGRTFLEDLRCAPCKEEGKHARYDVDFPPGTVEHAFTMHSMPALKAMTLFDLGYPLGAHIRVIQRNGALDFLDEGKITTSVFTCMDDPAQFYSVEKLR